MLTNKLTGAGAADKTYIEDVFSTYLYTGTGATQTINNGIDLAGKGGMVWIKGRSAATDNAMYDTARGATYDLVSNTFAAQTTQSTGLTSFGSTGFNIGALAKLNTSAATYASWTFRKAPKFFDVVTYTGNEVAGRTISHSLGQAPGMIIVKCTSQSNGAGWVVWHRSLNSNTGNGYLYLQNTAAYGPDDGIFWGNGTSHVDPTSSTFTVNNISNYTNALGQTYVAYLFAHDTTTDGLIQCGSYTGNESATGPSVTLGWEPQYLMIKNATGTGNWQIIDNMRGMPVGSADATLQANLSNSESSVDYVSPTAIGFQVTSTSTDVNTSGSTYIYMAIRRGPMRTPTDGTKVFSPVARTGTGANAEVTSDFTTDMVIVGNRTSTAVNTKFPVWDRLRNTYYSLTTSTIAEVNAGTVNVQANPWDTMTGFKVGTTGILTNASGNTFINYLFKRAPGFFDVVCYTGTGVNRTVNHNLGVAPELVIIKCRTVGRSWCVGYKNSINNRYGTTLKLNLTSVDVGQENPWFNDSGSTLTTLSLGSDLDVNGSGQTYVSYLFASCPGVSKVGSFTGNGSTQTINCGFTNGARFVLIKRTDSTSNWMVWDTARGITTTSDPLLLLNSTAAETSGADQIQPNSTGFTVQYAGPSTDSAPNINGATYIYLAIA